MTASPSGRQYELKHGEQHAVVVELGAGLREYRSRSAPIVDGYALDERIDGGRGQLLIPWPNRIANARYRFGGADYKLPVTEPRTGSAIHGLTRSLPWTLVEAASHPVTLTLDLAARDGYPFHLGLTATYELDAGGLTVTVGASNLGIRPCPYGAGGHPYVRVAGLDFIDEALLDLPADATLEADDNGIPTGAVLPVDNTEFDFRSPRRIGALKLDTAYGLLHAGADVDEIDRPLGPRARPRFHRDLGPRREVSLGCGRERGNERDLALVERHDLVEAARDLDRSAKRPRAAQRGLRRTALRRAAALQLMVTLA